jgi:hypothetical protein
MKRFLLEDAWMGIGAKCLCVAAGVAFLASIVPASAQSLTPDQIVKTSNLTQQEIDYYQKLSDPVMAKNFLLTRSYVRLCQQVIDHRLPAVQLPDKPLGFSVRFLLPGEATLINTAISDSIIAAVKEGQSKH